MKLSGNTAAAECGQLKLFNGLALAIYFVSAHSIHSISGPWTLEFPQRDEGPSRGRWLAATFASPLGVDAEDQRLSGTSYLCQGYASSAKSTLRLVGRPVQRLVAKSYCQEAASGTS